MHIVANDSDTFHILGETEAQIVLDPKAVIYFYVDDARVTGDIGSKTWNNFYSDSNNKETANGLKNETYVWATNLGTGDDESGWVREG
ncbi:MAG: hypothetical protein LBT00_09610 [Spirochaetaceae bacterium]|nr:hypothetical protein [Spirochaetaceae bacterium]